MCSMALKDSNTKVPVEVDKADFEAAVKEFAASSKNGHSVVWTKDKISSVIEEVEAYYSLKKSGGKLEKVHYNRSKVYDVTRHDGQMRLLKKNAAKKGLADYVLPFEEYHSVLSSIHDITCHGGREKMIEFVQKEYYIPKFVIQCFMKCCPECQSNSNTSSKGLVVRPIITKDFNERCQVDLIDFQSRPDGAYKWVLHYMDHLTKWSILEPLKSKSSSEVSDVIYKIFCTLGAPKYLQSDNGREFVNTAMQKMINEWPDCLMVHGRPRYPQSQGAVERGNGQVQKMLKAVLSKWGNNNWVRALPYVQYAKNTSYHFAIKMTPYQALYGRAPPRRVRMAFEAEAKGESDPDDISISHLSDDDNSSGDDRPDDNRPYDGCNNVNDDDDDQPWIKERLGNAFADSNKIISASFCASNLKDQSDYSPADGASSSESDTLRRISKSVIRKKPNKRTTDSSSASKRGITDDGDCSTECDEYQPISKKSNAKSRSKTSATKPKKPSRTSSKASKCHIDDDENYSNECDANQLKTKLSNKTNRTEQSRKKIKSPSRASGKDSKCDITVNDSSSSKCDEYQPKSKVCNTKIRAESFKKKQKKASRASSKGSKSVIQEDDDYSSAFEEYQSQSNLINMRHCAQKSMDSPKRSTRPSDEASQAVVAENDNSLAQFGNQQPKSKILATNKSKRKSMSNKRKQELVSNEAPPCNDDDPAKFLDDYDYCPPEPKKKKTVEVNDQPIECEKEKQPDSANDRNTENSSNAIVKTKTAPPKKLFLKRFGNFEENLIETHAQKPVSEYSKTENVAVSNTLVKELVVNLPRIDISETTSSNLKKYSENLVFESGCSIPENCNSCDDASNSTSQIIGKKSKCKIYTLSDSENDDDELNSNWYDETCAKLIDEISNSACLATDYNPDECHKMTNVSSKNKPNSNDKTDNDYAISDHAELATLNYFQGPITNTSKVSRPTSSGTPTEANSNYNIVVQENISSQYIDGNLPDDSIASQQSILRPEINLQINEVIMQDVGSVSVVEKRQLSADKIFRSPTKPDQAKSRVCSICKLQTRFATNRTSKEQTVCNRCYLKTDKETNKSTSQAGSSTVNNPDYGQENTIKNCKTCNSVVFLDFFDMDTDDIFCELCSLRAKIDTSRAAASSNLQQQAKQMVAKSNSKFPPIPIEATVLIDIPKFDRGPMDAKNLIGKVIESKHNLYRVGTSAGILKNWLAPNSLTRSSYCFKGVIPNKEVSLREAANIVSQFDGQGYQRCNCKMNCDNLRCLCKKKGVLCNSRCHNSLSCKNK